MQRALSYAAIGALVGTLIACSGPGTPATGDDSAATETFTSERYGLSIAYPAELRLRYDFSHSTLDNGAWKTYASADAPAGEAVAALVMPGSDRITSGELRIGASRDPKAVAACTQLPSAARPDSRGSETIDGVTFTTYAAGDAGMSHYLATHSYRAVHAGVCYAIDVLAYGSNPQVYDPPVEQPFTRQQVFERLQPVVEHLRFTTAGTPAAAHPTGA